jgi:hypothetical protein
MFQPYFIYHIALKAHEYELAAETLDKILNIDANADLEQILAGLPLKNLKIKKFSFKRYVRVRSGTIPLFWH